MLFPGLPRAFPNAEWNRVEDIFRQQQQQQVIRMNLSNVPKEEQWVQQELQYYESSFTTVEDLHVCVTTFNVGCKKPILPLDRLVAQRNTAVDGAPPVDLLVIAFQEVDMSASAMFREETEAATPWVSGVLAAAGADTTPSSATPYFAFPAKQLVGLLLCVCVRRALLPQVSEFSIATRATGAMGTMGNKGAVGVHLKIHRTSICILTAHLAAGQANVSKRNDDINTILKQTDFNAAKRAEVQMNAGAGVSSGLAELQFPELYPRDHDIIIVAGDLNYRLDMTYEQAVDMAARGEIREMLKYDQLEAELRNPHTPWQGFFELVPTHAPTYRYDIGTNTYDTSEKRRVPSFTDRILIWMPKRARVETAVKVDALQALTDVMSSDHKPVQALVRVPVSVEVAAEKQKVLSMLREKVATMGLDRAACGRTTIDQATLNFDVLCFHSNNTKHTLVVTNVGDCTAVGRVLRQRTSDDSFGAWLRVSPLEFAITPGDSQEFTVETSVDPRCMPWLGRWRPYDGRGRIALSSNLLITVRNGPTHMVECKAVLKPSIFANSLENIMLLGGVSCVEAYQRKGDLLALMLSLRPQIPKEMWALANVIAAHPREEGLFTQSISADECDAVMEYLDTHGASQPLPPDSTSAHCAAECLLTILKNLQEPVVPFAQYTAALAAGRARGKQPIAFLRSLPTMHANLWVYVLSLLNYLLRPVHARCNQLTAELLAQVFGAVLLLRPVAAQGFDNARLLQGGGVDQSVRQQLQQEKEDAKALVEYFLITPPALLQQ